MWTLMGRRLYRYAPISALQLDLARPTGPWFMSEVCGGDNAVNGIARADS